MMRVSVAVVVLLMSGCGGDGGGTPAGGDPLTPTRAAELCADTCTHAVSCAWTTDMTACETDCASQSNLFRGDGYTAWIACLTAADCGTPNAGEACYIDAANATDARTVHDDYVSMCTAAQAQCTGLPANVCDLDEVILFSDGYMTNQVLPCFAMGCTEMSACLETYVLDAF